MITLNKIIITLIQVANYDSVFITGIRPVREWKDGKVTDNIIGYKYNAICHKNGYCCVDINIKGKPLFSQEDIDDNDGSIEVKPINFEGRFFQNKNKDVIFTATATDLLVVR